MARMNSEAPWVVLKFGGTSVASLARWRIIASVLRERLEEGVRPVVVCSALAGKSDLLEQLLAQAEAGGDVRPLLSEVAEAHRQLAADMELDADQVIGELLEELERLARGARLVEEASPRVRARVMSMGELMSTRLGAAWLRAQGLAVAWADARELLVAQTNPHVLATAPAHHYLSAVCSYEPSPDMQAKLDALDAGVVLTQGFIASDAEGDTVLLGRGGSDTSAAYFAASLGARRLEIWTDVPGMFTANPRSVPSARLLRRMRYREAQELALMGARVLHPRCIEPVASTHIPLHIKWSLAPERIGTIISSGEPTGGPRVRAVSLRKHMLLLSMKVDRALQNAGILAESAACLAKWNVSIDMVAASETNITFSVDPSANRLDDTVIQGVLADLNALGRTRQLGPGAALSLVGTKIRAILHELGPTFARFEDHEVYMVSQAADDLNFTFIVEERDADALLSDLHSMLFPPDLDDPSFGPRWDELFDEDGQLRPAGAS